MTKELEDASSEPLNIIFEKYWNTGEVPGDGRRATLVPISKKGKKSGPRKLQTSHFVWGNLRKDNQAVSLQMLGRIIRSPARAC